MWEGNGGTYITRSDCNTTHLEDHEDVSVLADLTRPVPRWVSLSDVLSVYLLVLEPVNVDLCVSAHVGAFIGSRPEESFLLLSQ